jgi:hypothetical protein
MITQSQINLGEDTCSLHLVEEILDPEKRVLVLNGDLVQRTIIHIYPLSSIFLHE